MLAPEVQRAWARKAPRPTTRHYVNLSRGLLQEHLPHGTPLFVCRISSTWCEQKRWGHILETLSPDVWWGMAIGDLLVFHDVSERQRSTRAMWQGLSWIRYAANRAWGLPEQKEISRSGMVVNQHWDHVYRNLSRPARNVLKYYGNYVTERSPVVLQSCDVCRRGGLK